MSHNAPIEPRAAAASAELDAALAAAAAANRIVRDHYGRAPDVSIKPDRSPVTVADLAVERTVREQLLARFPDHAFLGEETGRSVPRDGRPLWIVDPIDGTRAFIGEYPMFSTQIALLRQGSVTLGVSSAALYGELAWAERGGGAWLNGRRVSVSDKRDLADAVVSVGMIRELAAGPRWANYGRLVQQAAYSRGYGEFLQYHLVAAGKIDVAFEVGIKIYDIAALSVIVSEAGGRCTEIDGSPIGEDSTSIVATNGWLHEQVLAALNC